MKGVLRVLKWLALGVAGLLVVVILALLVFVFGLRPRSRPAEALKAPTDEATVARGKYLVESVGGCFACHSDVDESQPGPVLKGPKLAGRRFAPRQTGVGEVLLSAPNITNAPAGIGQWSDGEVVRAIREGISRDGRPLTQIMPYPEYASTLSKEDALAIVAYLRSVPPSSNAPPPSTFPFVFRVFSRLMPEPVEKEPTQPAPGSPERGEWLLKAGGCRACHEEDFTGSPEPFQVNGQLVTAPNITQDATFGIGGYSEAELRRVLDEGVNRAGKPLLVMPTASYRTLTDEDKAALVAALKRIPAKTAPQPE